jgi:hypothetical protein
LKGSTILGRIHIPMLLGVTMLLATFAAAADVAHVVKLQDQHWTSRLKATAASATPTTFRTSDCPKVVIGFPGGDGTTQTVVNGGSQLVEDFGTQKQCSMTAPIGLLTLETSGPVNLTTEAIYSGSHTVQIPALTDALTPTTADRRLEIDGIESTNGRQTDVAVLPDAAVWITLHVFDGDNHEVGDPKNAQIAFVRPPYTLVRVAAQVKIGRVEIVEGAPNIASGTDRATVYAIGFVGDGVGNPGVIPAKLITTTTAQCSTPTL